MSDLIHLIYVSVATDQFAEADLIGLLDIARVNNAAIEVTGMLLYSERNFFQVLEGEQEVVEGLYEKIASDSRHGKVTKIIQEPIEDRAFGKWTMGYTGASREQLRAIDGLSDFFSGGTCLAEIDSGRSKKLLGAFAKGRWRQNLD